MSKIKNIIFDFDGTLADTSKLIVSTMQKTINDMSLPYRDEEQIKTTIGIRLEEIPLILWPYLKGISDPFASIYRNNFEELKDKISATLFYGVKETMSKLKKKGYQMAIATSRGHESVDELTLKLEIRDCLGYLLGGDDVSQGKPNPESINKIISQMNWNKDETMMVGDMALDILMGKNAGIRTCGVTYGNGKLSELEEARADYIITDFSNLLKIL